MSGIAWAESGDGRMADLLGGGRRRACNFAIDDALEQAW